MALSKKDLMIHITLNELYNTHSLLLQHIDTLVSLPFACRSNVSAVFLVPQRQTTSSHSARRTWGRTVSSSSKRKSHDRTLTVQPMGDADPRHSERPAGQRFSKRHALYGGEVYLRTAHPINATVRR